MPLIRDINKFSELYDKGIIAPKSPWQERYKTAKS